MKRMTTFAAALALIAIVATPALAMRHGWGDPGGHDGAGMERMNPADRMDRISEELDLSDEQREEIQAIILDSREQARELRADGRANREALRELTEADTLDEGRLRRLLREQADLQAERMIERHAVRSKIDKLLTPEQQARRDELREMQQEQRRDHRDHRGPGKPGRCFEERG